jgi:hypothetical protein
MLSSVLLIGSCNLLTGSGILFYSCVLAVLIGESSLGDGISDLDSAIFCLMHEMRDVSFF